MDKACGLCGKIVPADQRRKAGTWCKPCHRAKAREWNEANPERSWSNITAARLRRHGVQITGPELLAWYREQPQVCAICEQPETHVHKATGTVRRLSIDHDYVTLTLRGLLCGDCNRAVGLLRDDPQRMRDAAAYVERFRAG